MYDYEKTKETPNEFKLFYYNKLHSGTAQSLLLFLAVCRIFE